MLYEVDFTLGNRQGHHIRQTAKLLVDSRDLAIANGALQVLRVDYPIIIGVSVQEKPSVEPQQDEFSVPDLGNAFQEEWAPSSKS